MKKVLIGIGIAAVIALGSIGLFASNAFAQGPAQNPNAWFGVMHGNQAMLDLLKISGSDLIAQRQAGQSLLDIATAKGVSEKQLVDALVQPIAGMHTWMGQTYGNQSYSDQMTQLMRDWIARDIRATQFGTMTDFRLGLSGFNGANGWGDDIKRIPRWDDG